MVGPKGWRPRKGGGTEKGWGPRKGGGPERVGARRVEAPNGWRPRRVGGGGPEGWGAQNFALFFPSPAAKFRSFLPSLVSSRGILVVF